MCGIYATNAGKLYDCISSLKELEYRGYDSVGFLYITKDNKIGQHKAAGNFNKLLLSCKEEDLDVIAFMGHTRWATHGKPTKENAHPHLDNSGRYAIVHNGIVENYKELIKKYNIKCQNDTDTEVLINIIAEHVKDMPLEDAISKTFAEVTGANSCIILDTKNPSEFYMVERGSRLTLFLEDKNDIVEVSSDIITHKNHGAYYVTRSNTITQLNPSKIRNKSIRASRHISEEDKTIPSKGKYESYMLKEIYDQPAAIEDVLRGRLFKDKVILGGLNEKYNRHLLKELSLITILGCGSSLHSAMIGQRYIENIARIRVHTEQAAEFKHREPFLMDDEDSPSMKELFICMSQSGETADVLQAMSYIHKNTHKDNVMGICNRSGSRLSNETSFGIHTRAGVEVGVASTKTFTNQVLSLLLLALNFNKHAVKDLYTDIKISLPETIHNILHDNKILDSIQRVAEKIANKQSCIFLGRCYNYPIALEGALKMKELAYIHAEGYSAAEMKHGPLALISDEIPTIAFANKNGQYDKTMSNISEIQARNGEVFLITDTPTADISDSVTLPLLNKYLSPILFNVASQLLSYHVAKLLEKNVDQPRNLAKSVTVE